jgi:hypothetical protein
MHDKPPKEWVDWVCPFCEAKVDDPASIKGTSCPNGHIVYLGKIVWGPHGGVRRAYKSKGERRREERNERIEHATYETMLRIVFRPEINPKTPTSE